MGSFLTVTALVAVMGGGWWLGYMLATVALAWLDPTDAESAASDVDA